MPVRASKACQNCRLRKVRCDVEQHGFPCQNCGIDQTKCFVQKSRRGKYVCTLLNLFVESVFTERRKCEADINLVADARGGPFRSSLPRLASSFTSWRLPFCLPTRRPCLKTAHPTENFEICVHILLDGVWSRLPRTLLRPMKLDPIHLRKGTTL